MNNQTEQITDLDQTDEDILTYEVSDDALEAAAGRGEELTRTVAFLLPSWVLLLLGVRQLRTAVRTAIVSKWLTLPVALPRSAAASCNEAAARAETYTVAQEAAHAVSLRAPLAHVQRCADAVPNQ